MDAGGSADPSPDSGLRPSSPSPARGEGRQPTPRAAHSRPAALLLFAAGVVGSNAVILAKLADERRAWDAAAAERVRAVLRGGGDVIPRGPHGPEPWVGPLPTDPPYLPHGAAFFDKYAPAVGEQPTGATGWLRLPGERSARCPLSVVAVRRGEVVPVRAGYWRLSAVERLTGGACVGFQAVLPPGGGYRLFAVPSDAGLPVVELNP